MYSVENWAARTARKLEQLLADCLAAKKAELRAMHWAVTLGLLRVSSLVEHLESTLVAWMVLMWVVLLAVAMAE